MKKIFGLILSLCLLVATTVVPVSAKVVYTNMSFSSAPYLVVNLEARANPGSYPNATGKMTLQNSYTIFGNTSSIEFLQRSPDRNFGKYYVSGSNSHSYTKSGFDQGAQSVDIKFTAYVSGSGYCTKTVNVAF